MYLKTKIEKLEDKVGIRKRKRTIIVSMMEGETREEVLRYNDIPPGIDIKENRLIFVITNVPRAPNDPPNERRMNHEFKSKG